MSSPKQTLRNRIGGKLRQDPGADVTELRSDLATAKLADDVEDWVETWSPTPEQVDLITRILNPETGGR
jgi:hypothetical protein